MKNSPPYAQVAKMTLSTNTLNTHLLYPFNFEKTLLHAMQHPLKCNILVPP